MTIMFEMLMSDRFDRKMLYLVKKSHILLLPRRGCVQTVGFV